MSEESPWSCLESRLVFATGDAHKISGLEAILAPAWQDYAPGTIVRMPDFNASAPPEDGVTFEENSLIKARTLVEFTNLPALVDGSGICVNVMDGVPGIFSARWYDAHGDDAANLDLLLAQLADVPSAHRGAAFVSAAALALPDGREFAERGEIRGTLIGERHGESGFGYDPIFVLEGCSRTSVELSPKEKNATSHRGETFCALLPAIIEALEGR